MPTYTDIKRYDLDPVLLFRTAKQTLVELSWMIKKETDDVLVADVPKNNFDPAAVITVIVCYGYINLSCKTERLSIGNIENALIVDRFVRSFNQKIASVPLDQQKSIRETHKLSFI